LAVVIVPPASAGLRKHDLTVFATELTGFVESFHLPRTVWLCSSQ
jgi:hypothetical protein